jgi:hypothetical protein
MFVEIYTKNSGPAYQHSEEELNDFNTSNSDFFPIVVQNNSIIALQPWDPSSDSPWSSEGEAMAWGESWISARKNRISADDIMSAQEEINKMLGITE